MKAIHLILHLDVRGAGEVTAADIQAPAEVEIVNPDLYLFTVDDAKDQVWILISLSNADAGILPPATAVENYQSVNFLWMRSIAR